MVNLVGGAIAHLNVDTRLDSKEKMKSLIKTAAENGVLYFAINYNLQQCEDEHMSVGKKEFCDCGKPIVRKFY